MALLDGSGYLTRTGTPHDRALSQCPHVHQPPCQLACPSVAIGTFNQGDAGERIPYL